MNTLTNPLAKTRKGLNTPSASPRLCEQTINAGAHESQSPKSFLKNVNFVEQQSFKTKTLNGGDSVQVEFNEADARLHYKFLQHAGEGQTEIRVFDPPYKEGRSFFVWNENEFIDVCKKLHSEGVREYLGVNMRSINKKSDADVTALNGVSVDIDGIPHDVSTKPFCLELLREYDTYMQKQKLPLSIGETAAGYCPYIFLDKPIQINKDNQQEVRNYLFAIKGFLCAKFKREKAEIDPTGFNPSRVTKIIGSFDFSRNGSTRWLRKPVFVKTENFLAWVKSLPEVEIRPGKNHDTQVPKKCAFCEHALTHKINEGGRYRRVAPSLAAYVRNSPNKEALHRQFQQVQDPSRPDVDSLSSWDRKPSKFWCGQLRHFAEEARLGKICNGCLEEML